MKQWPFQVVNCPPGLVKACVQDEQWQKFRKSLKGVPTEQKLNMLAFRLETALSDDYDMVLVQTSNYINALKRGGQLSMDLEVVR